MVLARWPSDCGAGGWGVEELSHRPVLPFGEERGRQLPPPRTSISSRGRGFLGAHRDQVPQTELC